MSPLLHVSLGAHMLVRQCVCVVCWEEQNQRRYFPRQASISQGCSCGFSSFLPSSSHWAIGHRDELHNIMRLWVMHDQGNEDGSYRSRGKILCEKCVWMKIPYTFSGCKLTDTKLCVVDAVCLCSALLVAGWGDYCCAEHAVPGSATQSLKPATLPLECLVWGQHSSYPGRNWIHK